MLVIDDDVALTEMILAESGTWNMRVEIAANLTAARSAIARCSPDIILLDLTLDNTHEDGLMLLKELASQTPTLPVLPFTGRDNLSDRVEVARLGGRGFLSKPIPIDQIFQTTTQVLAQMRSPEATIMIVDDDPAILVSLSTLLEPWGFRVIPLEDRLLFWELLTASSPDLQRLASMDGLTQVANRRCFDEIQHREWKRLQREQLPLSLILCYIDFLKNQDTSKHDITRSFAPILLHFLRVTSAFLLPPNSSPID